MPNVLDQMRAMSLAPSTKESFDLWLQGADALEFLRTDSCQNEIVIYAGVDHVFIHGILVPAALLVEVLIRLRADNVAGTHRIPVLFRRSSNRRCLSSQ